jgi:hypothetical protein
MDKRVAAAMIRHQLTPEMVGGRLFIVAKGEMKFKMAKYGRSNIVEINETLKQQLISFVSDNKIDVVSIDPVVKTHAINENFNIEIAQVVEAFDEIATGRARDGDRQSTARGKRCAVHLWAHTGKMRGEGATVESVRGAKALTDAVRSARILETMSKDEAKDLKLDEPGFYFRGFNGKRNFAPPSAVSDWYRLVNVPIDNGFPGDELGVVTRWEHPGAEASVALLLTQAVIDAIRAVVRAGEWRAYVTAAAWVGKPIAKVMNLDPDEDRETIQTVIKKLIQDGVLKEVQRRDNHRESKVFVEVA